MHANDEWRQMLSVLRQVRLEKTSGDLQPNVLLTNESALGHTRLLRALVGWLLRTSLDGDCSTNCFSTFGMLKIFLKSTQNSGPLPLVLLPYRRPGSVFLMTSQILVARY